MKKKLTLLLTIIATVCVLGATIGTAWGYFTTHAEAKGYKQIHLGDRTEVKEEFEAWTKKLSVTSDADSQPVWVRAKVFAPVVVVDSIDPGTSWTLNTDDGYYYYNEVLNGGETTANINVNLVTPTSATQDEFNVVFVYESVPVHFDEDGEPLEADWEGGNEQ